MKYSELYFIDFSSEFLRLTVAGTTVALSWMKKSSATPFLFVTL
jgi:hypothetical protein